jgi:flagellar hook-associated protein 3 FlgL
MRITNKMTTENAISYMEDNLSRLNSLNERIASGKQFQTMSDDPTRAASALSLRSSLQANQTYLDTNNAIDEWLSSTDTALKDMIDVGNRAKKLMIQGANDTLSDKERSALAGEIDQMVQQGVDIGNTQYQGKYIFAGFQTKSAAPPFILDAAHTTITPPSDGNAIKVDISPGQTLTTNIPGKTVLTPFLNALIGARDALLTNNSANISAAMGILDGTMEPVYTASTTNGGRQRQLLTTMDSMEKAKIGLQSLLSATEDTNMAEAIAQLRSQETAYQSVLEVSQRALSMTSIFDVMS